MKKYLFSIFLPLMALCLLAACPQPEAGRPDEAPSESERITIKMIQAKSAEMTGQLVTLDVEFRGWTGACSPGPPVTRSDWMVEDGTGCIYVHGPLPHGLDSSMPRGERLTLTGTVRIDRQGRPYLELHREK